MTAHEGGAPQAMASVGEGERVVERVCATMEEVDPTMCPLRVHTLGSGTGTACEVWGMQDAVPGRVGKNLGTLGVYGPAVALDSNARRPCPCIKVPHSLVFCELNPARPHARISVEGGGTPVRVHATGG